MGSQSSAITVYSNFSKFISFLDLSPDEDSKQFLMENCSKNTKCKELNYELVYMMNAKNHYFYMVSMMNLKANEFQGIYYY